MLSGFGYPRTYVYCIVRGKKKQQLIAVFDNKEKAEKEAALYGKVYFVVKQVLRPVYGLENLVLDAGELYTGAIVQLKEDNSWVDSNGNKVVPRKLGDVRRSES